MAWYRTTYPEINKPNIADPENLREAVPAAVALKADIEHWTKISYKDTPNYNNEADPFGLDLTAFSPTSFPSKKDLYGRYFHWCWAEEKNEEVIPGSRPPIGKYAPRQRRDKNGNNKFDREGGGRQRQNKVQMHKRKRRHNKEKTAELGKAAKKAVEDAVAKLKGGESEVTLKPANSYYRRIQHNLSKELGLRLAQQVRAMREQSLLQISNRNLF